MAENEKKQDKRFSSKWLIAISIILLIGIIVIVVIACLPKNIGKAVKQTNTFANTMFLVDDNVYTDYSEFIDKINRDPVTKELFGGETENATILSLTLSDIMKFYNDKMVFAKDNKTFQNNYNGITKNLSRADRAQETMESIVAKFKATIKDDQNSTFFQGAWEDFSKAFKTYLESTVDALMALDNVYSNCVPKGVMVNDLNEFTRKVLKVYLTAIKSKKLNEVGNISEYLTGFSRYLNTDNSNNILNKFTFSDSLQEAYDQMIEVYDDNTTLLETMINSINSTGVTYVHKTKPNEYAVLKTFVEGGLKA